MACPMPLRDRTGLAHARDTRFSGLMKLALPAVLAVTSPAVARADSAAPGVETTESRLHRIEGELRALQRKVFPDGAGRTFAPEITTGDPASQPSAPTGNVGAVSDLLTRMDAVEGQLRALTASTEDNQNRLGKLEGRIGAVESARTTTAPGTPAPDTRPDTSPDSSIAPDAVAAPVPQPQSPARPMTKARPAENQGANQGAKQGAKQGAASASPSSPQAADHAAAVAAIDRPSSDDKGEDAYTYGYRLWEAKFFPEAEAVLLDFVQKYASHKRISYARNLLGRAYLDDSKVRTAAQIFLQNYLADKAGDRAADSLLYLAIAETRDKETARACKVLTEFRATYPTEATGRLKGQYDGVTKMVTCA